MRIEWIGKWKEGEIRVTAESVQELSNILEELSKVSDIEVITKATKEAETSEMPTIPGNLGCSEAVKEILKSPWGKTKPRTMSEIIEVMKTNGIFFPKSTLSGILVRLTKKQSLRRMKRDSMWAYIYAE